MYKNLEKMELDLKIAKQKVSAIEEAMVLEKEKIYKEKDGLYKGCRITDVYGKRYVVRKVYTGYSSKDMRYGLIPRVESNPIRKDGSVGVAIRHVSTFKIEK